MDPLGVMGAWGPRGRMGRVGFPRLARVLVRGSTCPCGPGRWGRGWGAAEQGSEEGPERALRAPGPWLASSAGPLRAFRAFPPGLGSAATWLLSAPLLP